MTFTKKRMFKKTTAICLLLIVHQAFAHSQMLVSFLTEGMNYDSGSWFSNSELTLYGKAKRTFNPVVSAGFLKTNWGQRISIQGGLLFQAPLAFYGEIAAGAAADGDNAISYPYKAEITRETRSTIATFQFRGAIAPEGISYILPNASLRLQYLPFLAAKARIFAGWNEADEKNLALVLDHYITFENASYIGVSLTASQTCIDGVETETEWAAGPTARITLNESWSATGAAKGEWLRNSVRGFGGSLAIDYAF
ncbi:MAG: hypothetical protein JXP39_06830 [Spirochaetales bacterium]|nr:hypothetical protein [Spirochaetales bacterium]